MFCPKCGGENAEGKKYCRSCGNRLSVEKNVTSNKMIGLAALAAATSLVFAFLSFCGTSNPGIIGRGPSPLATVGESLSPLASPTNIVKAPTDKATKHAELPPQATSKQESEPKTQPPAKLLSMAASQSAKDIKQVKNISNGEIQIDSSRFRMLRLVVEKDWENVRLLGTVRTDWLPIVFWVIAQGDFANYKAGMKPGVYYGITAYSDTDIDEKLVPGAYFLLFENDTAWDQTASVALRLEFTIKR